MALRSAHTPRTGIRLSVLQPSKILPLEFKTAEPTLKRLRGTDAFSFAFRALWRSLSTSHWEVGALVEEELSLEYMATLDTITGGVGQVFEKWYWLGFDEMNPAHFRPRHK
jgi:hypothetical protein